MGNDSLMSVIAAGQRGIYMDTSKLLKIFFFLIKMHVVLFALFAVLCTAGLFLDKGILTEWLYGVGILIGTVGFLICSLVLHMRNRIENLK
jgi:hypothetical protein